MTLSSARSSSLAARPPLAVRSPPPLSPSPSRPRLTPAQTGYDGPRTAKDIIAAATSAMPTFVKRAGTAAEVEALRAKVRPSLPPSSPAPRPADSPHPPALSPTQAATKPISLLFTSAGKVTPLYKALSTDFYRALDFYAARDEKVGHEAMRAFGVDKTPALLVLSGGDEVVKYDGASLSSCSPSPLKGDRALTLPSLPLSSSSSRTRQARSSTTSCARSSSRSRRRARRRAAAPRRRSASRTRSCRWPREGPSGIEE